jgi:hypothetical protein
MMASVSGRTVVNIFDSEPIFKKYSPMELMKFIAAFPLKDNQTYKPDVAVPVGALKIMKRPPEYTYKNTLIKAYRPDDPVLVQKNRSEQLHSIESNLRRRVYDYKFVNFE